jgi:hypothetical protein
VIERVVGLPTAALFVLLAATAGAGFVTANLGLIAFDGEAHFGAIFVLAIGRSSLRHASAR